ERRAASLSTTNRSRDVRNLTDRIAVTRQIDALLARYGTPELRLQKDIRFIENDLRTHLAGIGDAPEDDQRRLIDVAGPYVRGIDPEAFKRAKPLPAIAAYMARVDDLEGVATAHDYIANKEHRAHLTTTLALRDGR